jgi:predicted esterase
VDARTGEGSLNLAAPADRAGTSWRVRRGDAAAGTITLSKNGPLATGRLGLAVSPGAQWIEIEGPDGRKIAVKDALATMAADLVRKANRGWRVGLWEKEELAFAKLDCAAHVFNGGRFPRFQFGDPGRVERLSGRTPEVRSRWFDQAGRPVERPEKSGIYGARTEVDLKDGKEPIVLEDIFFKMPEGAGPPQNDGEETARILGFGLAGADATPSHAERVAGRWWHRVRKANGWAAPLAYKIHVPPGAPKSGRFPLIVHLHGTGQHTEAAADKGLALLAGLAGPGAIVVYPMSDDSWQGPSVGDMIDGICAQYPVDPNRISLIGFSMGGIGAWTVALDQPERFSCVVPIGGRIGSPSDAARLRGLPVKVFNGGEDPTTTPEEAAIMVKAIQTAGGTAELILLDGLSHGDSQEAAYRHPGLFPWMISQHRVRQP